MLFAFWRGASVPSLSFSIGRQAGGAEMAVDGASDAAGSAARRLFASDRPDSEVPRAFSSRVVFFASLSDENSGSSGDSSDEDDMTVASVDAASLDEQIRGLRERMAHLTRDGTDHDFVLGCERLTARKERCVAQAYANHAMSQRRARAVFEHACERARERYATRCARLQRAMDDELVRELQRLQNAKAGVAVSSRRRRGVRPPPASSSSSYYEPANGSSGPVASNAGLLSPPLSTTSISTSTALNDASADNWYYYDGASFPLPSSTTDGMHDSDVDDAVMAMSPADMAQRVRYEEKKRLDALLARPRVFAPLDQKLIEADVDADLLAIQRAMPHCRKSSSISAGRSSCRSSATDQARVGDKRADAKAPAATHKKRRQLVTPRCLKTTSSVGQAADAASTKTNSALGLFASRPPALSTSARLRFNPQLLREGQEVAVYRRRPFDSTTNAAGGDREKETDTPEVADSFDVASDKMECVLSGVIAAATSTHVFVLSVSGRFEPVLVADWANGLVTIRAVGNADLQRRKRRRQQTR